MTRMAPNPTSSMPTLSMAALQDALQAADPSVLVVSPRIVRRVIKQHAGISGIGLRVPHRKSYVIDRESLFEIVDHVDLDVASDTDLPESILLIARPSSEMLAELSTKDILLKCWRQVFHGRIHMLLDERIAQGRLTSVDVQRAIQEIGEPEFEEIRSVLKQEEYLLPPHSDTTVYIEFVAVYLELRYFVPSFLRGYFPSLSDFHRIDQLLSRVIDGEALLNETRPAGASDPVILAEVPSTERIVDRVDEAQPKVRPPRLPAKARSDRQATVFQRKANQVAALGNLVRAAILRTRGARAAHPEFSLSLREQARGDIARLVQRLQAALSFSDKEADEWSRSLHALLEFAAEGFWTPEARLLYDLQKVCVDHERGVYTLDVFGWAFSLGRKSIKRFLPGQRDVLMSKHLRGAARRLPMARITHRMRNRLVALLQAAVHRAEANLRARFKPVIERALDKVKLFPANPPEQVARRKLVDEILDRIVERGFLSMSDLRDGLSRNNLKLPDLASVQQFFRGDQLLKADRQLAGSLDGVYRGAEVYLRFPQRLSSLAFGTAAGRFLTRYVVLPYGGAFLILEGLTHLVNPVVHLAGHSGSVHFMTPLTLIAFGTLLLGLIQFQQFRDQLARGVLEAGRLVARICVEVPAWLAKLPWIQSIVRSRPYQWFKRYIFKPLALSLLLSCLVALFSDGYVTWKSVPTTFVIASLLLNSRLGRNVDEMVTDWATSAWYRLRIHVLATFVRFIMEMFHQFLEGIERVLYTVDEWLRFRAGESRTSTIVKAALGSVWFFVNYVIRFLVTLMVEPQVNPIKHFPVVTVSHKVMLPLMITIHKTLEGPLGTAWAWPIAGFIQFLFPGMFGFLVWELKENWRLYAANRPHNIQPTPIGHHGETMIQFLRPGFRSGTIPKLYARLRKASRKAYWSGNWKICSKQLTGLHHASETIRRFVDRELLETLHESRTWADRSIATGEIRLGCNRILIELYCPDISEDSLWLSFEEQSSWLVASIYKRGWADNLSYHQRHAFASALAGFYKMAGVDLVREQIESQLEPNSPGYEITEDALVVWPKPGSSPLVFPLNTWTALDGASPADSTLASRRAKWVFAAVPISWRRWVVTWELDQLGSTSTHQVLDDLPLLPT